MWIAKVRSYLLGTLVATFGLVSQAQPQPQITNLTPTAGCALRIGTLTGRAAGVDGVDQTLPADSSLRHALHLVNAALQIYMEVGLHLRQGNIAQLL